MCPICCAWQRRIGAIIAPRRRAGGKDLHGSKRFWSTLVQSIKFGAANFNWSSDEVRKIFLQQRLKAFTEIAHVAARRMPRSQGPSWADLNEDSETETENATSTVASTGDLQVEALPLIPLRRELEPTMDAEPVGTAWMWIFDNTDPSIIDIRQESDCNCLFRKKEEDRFLVWAKVAPKDRSATRCAQCCKTVLQHETACDYRGQTPCDWCNMFPCRHAMKCSRYNFSCGFCHYSSTGHCVGNPRDVKRHQLDSDPSSDLKLFV